MTLATVCAGMCACLIDVTGLSLSLCILRTFRILGASVAQETGGSLHTITVHEEVTRNLTIWRVLAVLVIVAMLAHWTWLLFTPVSASIQPGMQASGEFQAERLFGVASVSAVSSAMSNVRLIGVFAGNPGFAVMELDGKRQIGLATGNELVAGSKLVEVATDHVVIESGGVRQQIALEGRASAINSAKAASLRSVPSPLELVSPTAVQPINSN